MESRKELPEKQWETELEKRIEEMDRNNSGIKRMKKKDYIIAGIIVIVCLCSVVAGAFISGDSGNPAIEPTEEKETQTEEYETGAWEKGTLYHNDYEIILSCPEVGSPSGEINWSTYYQDDTGDIDVMVDFRFQDELLDEKKKVLEEEFVELLETELWNHQIVYYIADYEYEIGGSETLVAEQIVAMLPMEDGTYIQIEITGRRKALLEAEALLSDKRFQEAFTIEISKRDKSEE